MFITNLFNVSDLKEMKNAGFDAVIIGSTFFSIGMPLCLEIDEIKKIHKEAKELGLAIYVSYNCMIFDEEIEQLKSELSALKEIDVEGIYYSDLAIYTLGKELGITAKLIFAPGFILANTADTKAYLAQGIKQVELANELTLEEKIEIGKACTTGIQVAIHGYLVMSYSRRMLLENYFAEVGIELESKQDFNFHLIEETRENPMPILETEKGVLIFSPYILESFEEIEQLMNSGIHFFRIEGVFLGKEYVIDAIKAYRDILNGSDKKEVKHAFYQKYKDKIHASGFYYQKTNLVK